MWQRQSRANFYQGDDAQEAEIDDRYVGRAAFAGEAPSFVNFFLQLRGLHEVLKIAGNEI